METVSEWTWRVTVYVHTTLGGLLSTPCFWTASSLSSPSPHRFENKTDRMWSRQGPSPSCWPASSRRRAEARYSRCCPRLQGKRVCLLGLQCPGLGGRTPEPIYAQVSLWSWALVLLLQNGCCEDWGQCLIAPCGRREGGRGAGEQPNPPTCWSDRLARFSCGTPLCPLRRAGSQERGWPPPAAL